LGSLLAAPFFSTAFALFGSFIFCLFGGRRFLKKSFFLGIEIFGNDILGIDIFGFLIFGIDIFGFLIFGLRLTRLRLLVTAFVLRCLVFLYLLLLRLILRLTLRLVLRLVLRLA